MGERSVRAALIPSDAANPSAGERFRVWLGDQVAAQADRWRLWAPVAFGGGCAVYFALSSEPPLWPLLLAAMATVGAWFGSRRAGLSRRWTLPLLMLACLAAGLAAAKTRTLIVAEPVAPAMSAPTVIEGWVVDVDSRGERGARVVVAPVRVRGLAPEQTPVRLRATVRGDQCWSKVASLAARLMVPVISKTPYQESKEAAGSLRPLVVEIPDGSGDHQR
ncbi:MAG: hypothetical protein J0M36_09705 [Caulobacterales bacterium]|nr:hypothetical protein [Caulobacterales bacterium]